MTITIDGTTGIASVDGSAGSPSVRGSDANSGIVYAADTVALSTAGSERMRVNSDGRVGIGISSSLSCALHVKHATNNEQARFESGDEYVHISFKDSTTSNVPYLGAQGNNLRFITGGAERVRIQSGGGISFNGDTATENALSDYEEGTYTPVLSGTDGWTATASSASANYVKIGKVCIVSIRYSSSSLSGIGGSAGLRVNLPFTSKASGDNVGQMAISEWSIGSSSISWMGAKVNNSEGYARFQYHNGNNNNTNDLTKDNANDSMNFRGTITYITS